MTNFAHLGGVGDVAASHHAALSRSQAVASGLQPLEIRAALDQSALRRAAPNVYVVHGAPITWQQSASVATLTAKSIGKLSHRAAARLLGVDGFAEFERVEVSVPRGRRLGIAEVIVHQSHVPPDHWLWIDGIPCTSLARTLVDLPQVVSDAVMVRAIDDFQRKGFSLGWLEQMATSLQRPGQRGTKLILSEVERRRADGTVSGSWFERLIALAIASPTLPPLVQQHVIRASDGSFIARVDLAFPSVRLGIEAHSRSFHTGTHQQMIDQRRENQAIAEGWQFIYLGWADRKSPAQARQFLERVVARRMSDLGLSSPK